MLVRETVRTSVTEQQVMTKNKKEKAVRRVRAEKTGLSYQATVNAETPKEVAPTRLEETRHLTTTDCVSALIFDCGDRGYSVETIHVGPEVVQWLRTQIHVDIEIVTDPHLLVRGLRAVCRGTMIVLDNTLKGGEARASLVEAKVPRSFEGALGNDRFASNVFEDLPVPQPRPFTPGGLADCFAVIEDQRQRTCTPLSSTGLKVAERVYLLMARMLHLRTGLHSASRGQVPPNRCTSSSMDDKLKAYLDAANAVAVATRAQTKAEEDLLAAHMNLGKVLRVEARKRLYIQIGVFALALAVVVLNPGLMWPVVLLYVALFVPSELAVILTHRRFISEVPLRTTKHGTK